MKHLVKVLLVSLVALFPASSYGITKDQLWSKLQFPFSNAEEIETFKVAKQNLNMVEEILFSRDIPKDNGPARFNSMVVLREACEEGLITQGHFFDVLFRLYSQINFIAHPKRLEDSKSQIIGELANFAEQAHIPVSISFSGFFSLSSSMVKGSLIKNQGILTSLNQKIANAQKSLEKKDPAARSSATNQIQAAVNELTAQRGQGVTEDAFQILSAYCQNLINKIQAGHQ